MLRRTDPIAPMGWGMPHPALQRPAGRVTERTRWLWLVPLVVGLLTVFGWVASHDPGQGLALSNRGWLTIAAAAVLLVLISVHRTEGLGHLARVVAEYAVVAVLCVLLVTAGAAGVAGSKQHGSDPGAKAAAALGPGCPPVAQVRAWVACLWHQASEASEASKAKADQQSSGNGR